MKIALRPILLFAILFLASLSGIKAEAANFSVSGGKIISPNGLPWKGYGVAVYDADVVAYGAGLAATLQTEFPGIKLVRLAGQPADTPASYAPFVNAATAAGIAVVIENHDQNESVLTGSALTTESNWYAAQATYYLNNPYVMFQTMNEPGISDGAQMAATYTAIRGTGNNTILFMEAGHGAGGIANTMGDTSAWSSMHNIAWDLHSYNWQTTSSDIPTITTDQNSRISTYQAITSADGVMPVVSLETGEATNGTTRDAGGTQQVQATYRNPNLFGAAAWAWDNWGTTGLVNSLTNNGGNSLTTYGQMVATEIGSANKAALGSFQVANGKIIRPDGNVFHARGINMYTDYMGIASTNNAAQPLTTLFPHINFLRLNFKDGAAVGTTAVSTFSAFVNQVTAAGIVVLIDNHQLGDGKPPATGSALTSELNWIASIANTWKNNPYVWFDVQNEPYGSGVSAEQLQEYNAWRTGNANGTGTVINNNIILMQLIGGGNPNSMPGGSDPTKLDASYYTGMKNAGFDLHYYVNNQGSGAGSSGTDWATTLQTRITQTQSAYKSADGTMPVGIFESGDSTSGQSIDSGGANLVGAVMVAPNTIGFAIFGWTPYGPADDLVSQGTVPPALVSPLGPQTATGITAAFNADTPAGENLTIAKIPNVQQNTTFTVSGSISNLSSAPTLQYSDSGGTWQSLPGGATVSSTAFSFTHPGLALGSTNTVSVRDANTTTVVATSGNFLVTGPESADQTTVPPATSITDSALNVWTIASDNKIAVNNNEVAVTASVVELAYIYSGTPAKTVWQKNTAGNWYQMGFDSSGNVTTLQGPTTTSPLTGTPVETLSITTIPNVQQNTTFTVSGSISNLSSAPTLQYADSGGAWNALPSGASISATAYSFTHPGLSASATNTVSVRDANNTSVSVTSPNFLVTGGVSPNYTIVTGQTTTPSFSDDFLTSGSIQNTRTWQTGQKWQLIAPDTPDGRGGTKFGEQGDQWWTNPYNPSTPISGIYNTDSSGLHLGILATPSAQQSYINSTSGSTLNYVGGLLNTSQTNYQKYGYWEIKVAVPKVNGFTFQADIENVQIAKTWPPEIDLRISTQNGVETVLFQVAKGGTAGYDQYTNTTIDATAMHTYAWDWESSGITFYIDGTQVAQKAIPANANYDSNPMFLFILSGANYIGNGDPAAGSLPVSANVAAVNVYPSKPVATGGGGSITDANGYVWTITTGAQVAFNGTPDTRTSGVKELAYVNGVVWQENTASTWYYPTCPSVPYTLSQCTWSAGTATSPLPSVTESLAVNTIANQSANTSFTVTGTIAGVTAAPTLQYQDNSTTGTWLSLPVGASTTTTGFSFTHPGLVAGQDVVNVRDANATSVTAASNTFTVAQPVVEALTINSIATQTASTPFSVSGGISGVSSAPTLQYQDPSSGGSWNSLPGGSSVTSSAYSFTDPGLAATSSATISVRDANNTGISVTSPTFSVTTTPQEAIAVNAISTQRVGTSYAVSGTISNATSAPSLQFQDDSGSWQALPSGATVSSTAFSFTNPAPTAAESNATIAVRDSANTSVSATSAPFSILPATSPNDTVVTTVGPAIVDASGESFTITSTAQVAVNGVTDSTTSNVIALAYVNGFVWQENASHLWSSKAAAADSWSSPVSTSPLPAETLSLATIPTQTQNVSFTVSGTIGNALLAPVLQYNVSGGSWTNFPSGSSITTTSFAFVLPGISTVGPVTVSVRDANATTITATSNQFTINPAGNETLTMQPIGNQTVSIPFPVSGSIGGATSAPALQYSDNGGAFQNLPPGSSVTVSGYNFIHPAIPASQSMVVTVRDANNPTITVSSPAFSVLGHESPNLTTVTQPGPTIVDSAGNSYAMTTSKQVSENGVTDQTTSNVVELAYVNRNVWWENSSLMWFERLNNQSWTPTNGTLLGPLPSSAPAIYLTSRAPLAVVPNFTIPVPGIIVNDTIVTGNFQLMLKSVDGILTMSGAQGSGTYNLSLTGGLPIINSALAGLQFTGKTVGQGSIAINVLDPSGIPASAVVPVTVPRSAAITPPGRTVGH